MRYTVRRKDELLDEIVYNHYGESFGFLEQVLLANTFLYTQGVYLKEGSIINLPELEATPKSRIKLV